MKSQRRVNHYDDYENDYAIPQYRPKVSSILHGEHEHSIVTRLLSSVTEDVLKSAVISVILAVPCIRRSLFRTLFAVFLLGAIVMALMIYIVSSLLTSY